MILRYDNSLTGFCCLLGTVIKQRLQWTTISSTHKSESGSLFEEEHTITSDPLWAETVTKGLKERLGSEFIHKLGYAFLSEKENIETDLIQVTRSALRYGKEFLHQLHHPQVHALETAAMKTSRERHRLLGLVRFRKLTDESYFAQIAPLTNVCPLLGNHFAERFADQNWIIHDQQRNSALVGRNGCCHFEPRFEINEQLLSHTTEADVAAAWRSFYNNISNPQRLNPKLRNQFMPKYYWRNLTEMQPQNPEHPY